MHISVMKKIKQCYLGCIVKKYKYFWAVFQKKCIFALVF